MEALINRIIETVKLLGVVFSGGSIIFVSLSMLRTQKKFGYDLTDGTIIGVDNEEKKLIVRYCYNGAVYERSINADILFAANEIPPIGLHVMVKIDRNDISNPIDIVTSHAIGRRSDFSSEYTEFSKKRLIFAFITGVLMVCFGIYSLIKIFFLKIQ